jgi:LysM repeat protein
MKTYRVVGTIVLAHVAVGLIALLQGCETFRSEKPTTRPEPPVMPRQADPLPPPVTRPVTPPVTPPARLEPVPTTTYVVAKGDTLSQIARRYKVSMTEIMALSGLRDADRLREGQKLVLPGKIDLQQAPPPVTPPVKPRSAPTAVAPSSGAGGSAHEVRQGETLSHIAQQYKVSVDAIRQANNIKGDLIRVGQKLTIPVPAVLDATARPASQPPVKAEETIGETADAERASPPVAPTGRTSMGVKIYEVQPGDTVRSIAMNNAISASELRKLNRMSETAEVEPGQKITVPLPE